MNRTDSVISFRKHRAHKTRPVVGLLVFAAIFFTAAAIASEVLQRGPPVTASFVRQMQTWAPASPWELKPSFDR